MSNSKKNNRRKSNNKKTTEKSKRSRYEVPNDLNICDFGSNLEFMQTINAFRPEKLVNSRAAFIHLEHTEMTPIISEAVKKLSNYTTIYASFYTGKNGFTSIPDFAQKKANLVCFESKSLLEGIMQMAAAKKSGVKLGGVYLGLRGYMLPSKIENIELLKQHCRATSYWVLTCATAYTSHSHNFWNACEAVTKSWILPEVHATLSSAENNWIAKCGGDVLVPTHVARRYPKAAFTGQSVLLPFLDDKVRALKHDTFYYINNSTYKQKYTKRMIQFSFYRDNTKSHLSDETKAGAESCRKLVKMATETGKSTATAYNHIPFVRQEQEKRRQERSRKTRLKDFAFSDDFKDYLVRKG